MPAGDKNFASTAAEDDYNFINNEDNFFGHGGGMDITFIVEILVFVVEILVIGLILVHFHRLESNTAAVNRLIRKLDDHLVELDRNYKRIEKCVCQLLESRPKKRGGLKGSG
ncbi:MAG: hypothetical protein APZ16_04325 [Candidatus Hadarchaeum yellowstonense]|uniref:Uncharacterized protein n=1 Tax=Hadarchaeum yellowstonense TaxID=1776334 RepID=A0A147K0W8_HADYE|nr:MAG: hypothetical protein APZ16_04325 [Candidatus Hadarchaeum yellowstonense]